VSEETLFTAARRLVRNLNVDFPSGLISQETEAAAHTLQLMIEREQREALRVVENRLAENAPRL
jgi:hypothetical protein